jgi:coenzyme PQQ precursor peptide PqqA
MKTAAGPARVRFLFCAGAAAGVPREAFGLPCNPVPAELSSKLQNEIRETTMAWTTPTLVEICLGLEINGYLPAEF